MTFREKLAKEHPDNIDEDYCGGCYGCPSSYDYEPAHNCSSEKHKCTECWNREMPGTEEKPETNNIPVDMAALGTFIREIAKDPNLYISIGIGHGTLNIGITHTSEED